MIAPKTYRSSLSAFLVAKKGWRMSKSELHSIAEKSDDGLSLSILNILRNKPLLHNFVWDPWFYDPDWEERCRKAMPMKIGKYLAETM